MTNQPGNSMAYGTKGQSFKIKLTPPANAHPSLGAYNPPYESIKHLLSKKPPRPPFRPWLS